jgi:FkbM family methyltransferase
VLNDEVVCINGVLIDLNNTVFSKHTRDGIRGKQYENTETQLIRKYICPSYPVIDLGAGVGYNSTIVDREVHSGTDVVSIEANEDLIPVIERTREMNNSDFSILHSAYHPNSDKVDFRISVDFWESGNTTNSENIIKTIQVSSVSLMDVIKEYDLESPVQCIIDIESFEYELIQNERDTLREKVCQLIIEFHSDGIHSKSWADDKLRQAGFKPIDNIGDVYVYENKNIDTN